MAVYNKDGTRIDSGGSSQFASVKDFGATGNGPTDDSSAIQSALDSLKNTGGIIYFPVGSYSIGTMLHFYSHQTLLFENVASLKARSGLSCIIGSYVTTAMAAFNGTHDVIIENGTFDGNSISSNILLFGTVHAKNITFRDCSFINAYGLAHNLEINSSYNVKIQNCVFTRGSNVSTNGEMIQLDRANYGAYVETINEDGTNCKCIDISECLFTDNTASPAIGNHSGTPDLVNIHDNTFENFTGTRGAVDLASTNLSVYNNIFNGCTIGVNSDGTTHYIHDNRFVDATTAIVGTNCVAHNNMVNGVFVA